MKRSLFLIILLPVTFLLLVTACKHGEKASTIHHIVTGDFFFKPETIKLKAGQEVKIELTNEGNIEHEFMIGRGVKTEGTHTHGEMHEGMGESNEAQEMEHEHNEEMHDNEGMQDTQRMNSTHTAMSKGFTQDFFEGIDVAVKTEDGAEFMRMPGHGNMVLLKPRSRATITFTVPPDRVGEWEMACFIPGHYEAKMKGNVIVE